MICRFKFIFCFFLLCIVFGCSSFVPLAFAEGTVEQQPTTEEEYSPPDDFGLLNPIGNFLDEKKHDLEKFSDVCDDSVDDLNEYAAEVKQLWLVYDLLPGVITGSIIFILVLALVRKILGR